MTKPEPPREARKCPACKSPDRDNRWPKATHGQEIIPCDHPWHDAPAPTPEPRPETWDESIKRVRNEVWPGEYEEGETPSALSAAPDMLRIPATPGEALRQIAQCIRENTDLRSKLSTAERELYGTPDNAVWSKQQWIDNAAYWNKAWKEAVEYRDMNAESVKRLEKELAATEAELARVKEAISKGKIRYSRNHGMPNPSKPFPVEVVFSMQDWAALQERERKGE